jgi:predicted permease
MIIETFLQDLRIGLRVLIKEKSFCALAVFVLALGIGAVTTQFAVVNGVLLRGFSFPHAEELVDVQMADPANFTPANFNSRITTSDFVDLKASQTSCSLFSAYLNGSTVNLTYHGNPQRLQGAYVTADFFHTLGVGPVLGRDFVPEDDQPGVTAAVILGDAVWQRDFGGSRDVIGHAVRVNGHPGVVIGVMPPRFAFPQNEQIWLPINTEFPPKPRNSLNIQTVNVLGRLKPGVTLQQANAEMVTIVKRLSGAYLEDKQFSLGWVRPLIKFFTGGAIAGLLYTMLAFCGGVLLIACVNVMNMQFARATQRAKELAIRSSLGATRGRLIRQMLTESLLLSTLGTLLGISLAVWAVDWLNTAVFSLQFPPPTWMRFTIDGTVLAAVVGATVLAAVLSGLLPAWMASRASPAEVLKESGRGNTGRFVGVVTKGLVVCQILVTCILLIGALLQVQSITRQMHLDYGYNTGALLSARLGLMDGDYPTNESRLLFHEKLLRELRTDPTLAHVALTSRFQMVFAGNGTIELEGRQYAEDKDRPNANFENVSDGYFETLGQKLIAGRAFTSEDNDVRDSVAVVNATFAREFFGTESPVGRRFRASWNNGQFHDPWRTIIGVVSDVRMLNPFDTKHDNAGYYIPLTGSVYAYADGRTAVNGPQFTTILVQPRGDARPEAFDTGLRRAVAKVDPNLPLYFVATPAANLAAALAQNRVVALMFSVFGLVAVILASSGLYGVMSFAVNQRTQEFGIRLALGANHRLILGMIFRQVAWQLGLGLALGVGVTLLFATVAANGIANFLPQISARDPLTYAAVSVLLVMVSFLATIVPARRATRVDPMVALRAE